MATADRDSSSDIGPGPVPDEGGHGRGPFPGRTIWLDGDVLACACPDCGAPMSIRLWLMVADCWRCGASIELTDEQEQEARRLLEQRGRRRSPDPAPSGTVGRPAITKQAKSEPTPEPPRPAARGGPPTRQPGVDRALSSGRLGVGDGLGAAAAKGRQAAHATPDMGRRAAHAIPDTGRQPALATHDTNRQAAHATHAPQGTRARIPQLHQQRRTTAFWAGLSRDLPAWLVSLILHLVALLLLGLWVAPRPSDRPSITLCTEVGPEDLAGDPGEFEELLDPFQVADAGLLEMEVPADVIGPGEAEVELEGPALTLSEPPGSLPEFRELIASAPPALRGGMFLGRDPRFRAQMLRREGGTQFTEAAVARGLRWMARHQNADGSWSLNAFNQAPGCNGRCDGAGGRSDTAATALGLLPFLGAGQTHFNGDYQAVVRRGLRWLVGHQRRDGDLRDHQGHGRMYAHGMAAIVLCEAYAMTGDPWLRKPAQKALDFIVDAQHREGGWRYSPGQAGDTSVVGWQMMALQSGRMHYLRVPRQTLYLAGHFLDGVRADSIGGLYGYQPNREHTPAMTAEALLCRLYLGWPTNHRAVKTGVDYLLKHLPDKRSPFIYYWYYATQVMHHVGGEAWRKWNARMQAALLDMQETEGHAAGSWGPRGGFASRGGRIYMTSLAICTLEVYYRHMPLNQAQAVAAVERLDERTAPE